MRLAIQKVPCGADRLFRGTGHRKSIWSHKIGHPHMFTAVALQGPRTEKLGARRDSVTPAHTVLRRPFTARMRCEYTGSSLDGAFSGTG